MITVASRAIMASVLFLLGACAAIQSTEEVVLDYNRAFATSRNEMLVLNILRSAAREPMQFSTMGTVSGSVGNGAQLTIPFTNVIAGGRDIISPSLQINDAVNPQITVIPLGARDFVTGILTPLATDDIQLFLHGAWDAEFLLPLVIGGVVCPDGRTLINSGIYETRRTGRAESEAFRAFFRDSARTFRIETENGPGEPRVLTLTDEQTARLLREGIGANHGIESVEDGSPGNKRVTIRPVRRTVLAGLHFEQLCRDIPPRPGSWAQAAWSADRGAAAPRPGGRAILRSVQTMLYYLGEAHRVSMYPETHEPRALTYFGPNDPRPQILFRLQAGPTTGAHAVEVSFQGRRYSVPRIQLGEREDSDSSRDRTLKTLSFLDQLIALQTSEATIRSTQPLIVNSQ